MLTLHVFATTRYFFNVIYIINIMTISLASHQINYTFATLQRNHNSKEKKEKSYPHNNLMPSPTTNNNSSRPRPLIPPNAPQDIIPINPNRRSLSVPHKRQRQIPPRAARDRKRQIVPVSARLPRHLVLSQRGGETAFCAVEVPELGRDFPGEAYWGCYGQAEDGLCEGLCEGCGLFGWVWCVGGGDFVFGWAIWRVGAGGGARVVWVLEVPGPAAADEV